MKETAHPLQSPAHRKRRVSRCEPCSDCSKQSFFVGVDFDGLLVSQAVAKEANRRFFLHMRDLLGDTSIPEGSGSDYLEPVMRLMAKVHGRVATSEAGREAYLLEARRFYAVFVHEILANDAEKVFHAEIVRLLRRAKERGARLALISTSPRMIVEPALALLAINDLFDVVLASPDGKLLTKEELLGDFLEVRGLLCYIGDEEGDEAGANAHKIPFFRFIEGRTQPRELRRFLERFIPGT